MYEQFCNTRIYSDVEEPVNLFRYIDLVTDQTPEARLSNSDRHKRTVSPQSVVKQSGAVPTHPHSQRTVRLGGF